MATVELSNNILKLIAQHIDCPTAGGKDSQAKTLRNHQLWWASNVSSYLGTPYFKMIRLGVGWVWSDSAIN